MTEYTQNRTSPRVIETPPFYKIIKIWYNTYVKQKCRIDGVLNEENKCGIIYTRRY